MIGRLNHVAIAVPDLAAAITHYREVLGASLGEPIPLPQHGVRVAFADLGNADVELMEPFGEESPLASFLARNPRGGLHHVCYEVAGLEHAIARLTAAGARVLGDGTPRIGAHGKPVIFVHPADSFGSLLELLEVR